MLRRITLAIALVLALETMLAGQAAPQALTNDDVIAMFKGGLGESTIISAIQSQDTNFDISAKGLLQLKKAAVPPKIMDAVISAAGKRKAADDAAAKAKADADSKAQAEAAKVKEAALMPAGMPSAIAMGEPSVLIVQGVQKQPIPLAHAQVVQTKAKASNLSALASDGALSQAMSGVTQSLASAAMMKGSSKMASTAMMANPMVGGAMMAGTLFAHRKPTVTDVWAIPGPKSETAIRNAQPTFEVHYDKIPGVNPDEYEPVLLKLESAPNNFRLIGATQAKQDSLEGSNADWGMYSSFVEERVPGQATKVGPGTYQLQPTSALTAGEYGIVLRPINKDKKFSGTNIAQNTGDGLAFDAVWSFEIQ